MRYTDLNSSLEAHISTLRVVIAVLILIIFGLWVGWHGSNNDVRIHIPPDLRSGAILKADEISSANVYAFTFYIFQQLNHWAENGADDYGMQIFKTAPYLTPEFREYLINDLDIRGKKGELSGRTRVIHPVP
ncbi:MAG: TIGR03746 family integrating conjugative element protein, partial [Methylococcales bacterium]|nr:TIGR03746 family integrating conjugative element protein [Methylococcales bacterium]